MGHHEGKCGTIEAFGRREAYGVPKRHWGTMRHVGHLKGIWGYRAKLMAADNTNDICQRRANPHIELILRCSDDDA
jgi:hypothetical protein